jgi:hypothetical protein
MYQDLISIIREIIAQVITYIYRHNGSYHANQDVHQINMSIYQ